MKQVKNLKLTLIITIILISLSIVGTYFVEYINTDFCLGKISTLPFEKCINMRLEGSFVDIFYTLSTIGIFILFIKSISYGIIKLTNK